VVMVSVDAMAGGNGLVKLSDQQWELNVVASLAELRKLRGIQDTDWEDRRTLQVGTCLDAPVWWNEKDGSVYVLAGADDEVWDVAVVIPVTAVQEILALAEQELGTLSRSPRRAHPGRITAHFMTFGAEPGSSRARSRRQAPERSPRLGRLEVRRAGFPAAGFVMMDRAGTPARSELPLARRWR
jgi:hypothetical protein